MRLLIPDDCGNAPKKAQVRDWLVALYGGNREQTVAALADDAAWELVGAERHVGPEAIADATAGLRVRELHISSLISHGKDVAAAGSILTDPADRTHFAHFVTFTGHGRTAKIRSLLSYLVPG